MRTEKGGVPPTLRVGIGEQQVCIPPPTGRGAAATANYGTSMQRRKKEVLLRVVGTLRG